MARIQTVDGRSGLQAQFAEGRTNGCLLEIDSWIPSEMKAVSPLVDRLMRLIEGSRCVPGAEHNVQLALQEAVTNAVVHGNRMDAHKLVQVRCRCELREGVSIIVRDQGQGFDPKAVRDPLAVENLEAEHGRGIHLMKLAMDEVSFERGGTEVHMRKGQHLTKKRGYEATAKQFAPDSANSTERDAVVVGTRAKPLARQER